MHLSNTPMQRTILMNVLKVWVTSLIESERCKCKLYSITMFKYLTSIHLWILCLLCSDFKRRLYMKEGGCYNSFTFNLWLCNVIMDCDVNLFPIKWFCQYLVSWLCSLYLVSELCCQYLVSGLCCQYLVSGLCCQYLVSGLCCHYLVSAYVVSTWFLDYVVSKQ